MLTSLRFTSEIGQRICDSFALNDRVFIAGGQCLSKLAELIWDLINLFLLLQMRATPIHRRLDKA
jgi:hypothetical protein